MVFTRLSRLLRPRSVSPCNIFAGCFVCASSLLLQKDVEATQYLKKRPRHRCKSFETCYSMFHNVPLFALRFSDSIWWSNGVLLAAWLHVPDIRAPATYPIWFGSVSFSLSLLKTHNGWKVNRSAPTHALSVFLRHSLAKMQSEYTLGLEAYECTMLNEGST